VPIAGYCHECAEWVWVTEDWSCPKGHAAAHVNGWHDSETGDPPSPAAGASGTRVGFLADLSAAFAQSPSYSATWGTDTDMTVASNPVAAMWGTGKDRTEYTAALKVSEVDRAVYFWEQLSGQASGLGTVGPRSPGRPRPRSASGEWGYGTTKAVVEEVAARHGFTVRVVLSRRAAIW